MARVRASERASRIKNLPAKFVDVSALNVPFGEVGRKFAACNFRWIDRSLAAPIDWKSRRNEFAPAAASWKTKRGFVIRAGSMGGRAIISVSIGASICKISCALEINRPAGWLIIFQP